VSETDPKKTPEPAKAPAPATAPAPGKKPYEPPNLVELGTLKNLTATGSHVVPTMPGGV
jgi:hypothetical protein